ncbi:CocE/NonD family hydrolase [Microbacterium sp. GXF7504]
MSKPEILRVPLRDGVELGASLYRPKRASKGLLLARTPYGRGRMMAGMVRPLVRGGYTVLLVSSRGTADSGGEFDPMRTEAEDGQDVVAWMRTQPWYPGRFATFGGSYLGHTQWALLEDPPADHVTSIITVGPHDFALHAWGSGTFNLDFIGWSDLIIAQRSPSTFAAIRKLMTADKRLRPVLEATPLVDAAVAQVGAEGPWMRDRLTRTDIDDAYWAPMRHATAVEQVTTPVLIVSGWQDLFVGQSFAQYTRLRERGVPVGLLCGPWTHTEVGRGDGDILTDRMLQWIDHHLAGAPAPTEPPVQVAVTGPKRRDADWRRFPQWPPAGTARTLHLQPEGALADTPATDAAAVSFTYDPADPTPSVGGPVLTGGGYVDDTALGTRTDVLAFTGEPLRSGTLVAGSPTVTLHHRSAHPDADLFVRLCDVDPRGRSRNLCEAYLRLSADRGHGPIEVTLGPLAHRFAPGHRIRLLVAGGSFPQFPRNAGTGENPLTATVRVPNTHTVTPAGSSITLPVVTTA